MGIIKDSILNRKMDDDEFARLEAELGGLSSDEDLSDDGPVNGDGISWYQLLQEEREYHNSELIKTMNIIDKEIDEIIPRLKKEKNCTDDFKEEINFKVSSLNITKSTMISKFQKGKLTQEDYE